MKSIRSACFWIAVVVLAGVMFAREEGETAAVIKDAPAAVQKTVSELSKDATIRGFAQEEEDGKSVYELELLVDGHTRDVMIDQSGHVFLIEEEVDIARLPSAVRSAIEKQAGAGTIKLVESLTEDGKITSYEAQVDTAGKRSEVKVDPQGRLVP